MATTLSFTITCVRFQSRDCQGAVAEFNAFAVTYQGVTVLALWRARERLQFLERHSPRDRYVLTVFGKQAVAALQTFANIETPFSDARASKRFFAKIPKAPETV